MNGSVPIDKRASAIHDGVRCLFRLFLAQTLLARGVARVAGFLQLGSGGKFGARLFGGFGSGDAFGLGSGFGSLLGGLLFGGDPVALGLLLGALCGLGGFLALGGGAAFGEHGFIDRRLVAQLFERGLLGFGGALCAFLEGLVERRHKRMRVPDFDDGLGVARQSSAVRRGSDRAKRGVSQSR
ncbi:membrane hypothetical protein [Sphingomonas sp. AX6]|nr:membrane hypothetical protein [Sphingomonas sp. AX6]